MVGKNNYKAIEQKQAVRVNRYSIRRLSVGVASVAIAGMLCMTSPMIAEASELEQDATGQVEENSETEGNQENPLDEPKEDTDANLEENLAEQPEAEDGKNEEPAENLEVDPEKQKEALRDAESGDKAKPVNTLKDSSDLVVDTTDIEKIQEDATYVPGGIGDKQSYSGTVYVYRNDELNSVSSETLPGVNVYLQWVDYDGYVSNVYKTTSRPDGTFTFNLQQPEIDQFGKEHHFQLAANPNFAIRTWADNPDPEKYNLIKPGDHKYGFHKRLNRLNETWDFTAGINRVVDGQIVFQEKMLQNDWLVKPKEQWQKSPNEDGIWANEGLYGKVSGYVWFENGDPMGSISAGWKFDSWDYSATGTEVVASYVNDEVTRLFDQWKEANPNAGIVDFRKAQEEMIREYEKDHGKGAHIAETVVGKVNQNGYYYLPFRGLYGVSPYSQNSGLSVSHTITDEEYGKLVRDEDLSHGNLMAWNGTIGQKHRHINTDYMYVAPLIDNYSVWSNASQNNLFAPLKNSSVDPVGVNNNSSANISTVNFAVLAAQPMHNIKVYDDQHNYAKAGQEVENETAGMLPNREYQIRWFKDGQPIGEVTKVTSNHIGQIGSVPMTVPNDLSTPTIYTSGVFYAGESANDLGQALAADAFIAAPVIKYEESKGTVGKEATSNKPYFEDKDEKQYVPKFEADPAPTYEYVKRIETRDENNRLQVTYEPLETVKVGDQDIKVKVDPKTGIVTVSPEETKKLKENDVITVPISVKYSNGFRVNTEAVIKMREEENEKYEPKYESVEGKVGELVTVEPPKFLDQKSEEEDKPSAEPQPEGVTYKLGDNAPEGAKIDPETGEITYTPAEVDSDSTVEIPVKVIYQDKSEDDTIAQVKVAKVTDADKYDPKPVEQPLKTELNKVPEAKHGIANKDELPEGTEYEWLEAPKVNQVGNVTGKVKVTYPDKTFDEVEVPVEVVEKLSDADKYNPKSEPIVKEHGEVTTEDDIKKAVTVPDYPADAEKQPEIKVDDLTQLPDGQIPGEYEVDVTVTYPDGSEDKVKVKVTVTEKEADKYEPKVDPVEKEKGQATTEDDIKGAVTVPDYPADAEKQPEIKVDDPTQLPDGQTPGEYEVDVTVTYPDGSEDKVKVKVTVTEKEVDKYEPKVAKEEIEKGGTVDLTDNVTNIDELPEGTKVEDVTPEGAIDTETPGDYTGKIKVTYPDGSSEEVEVPVKVKDPNSKPEEKKTTVDDSGVKPVDPTNDPQDTGIKVENKDDDTKVSAKDEDGKDIPVEIDENGKVIVTPGTDVDGPIKVVIEDEDLPGGKVEIEVPVNGHEKGRDDNGSDKSIADKVDPIIPEKTEVGRPGLTQSERDEVERKIIDANKDYFPEGTKVVVDESGNATIIYPDGSIDTIPWNKLVYHRDDEGAAESDKPADQASDKDSKGTEEASSTAKSSAGLLPETGEADATAIFGAAALSVLAGLGLVAKRREDEEA